MANDNDENRFFASCPQYLEELLLEEIKELGIRGAHPKRGGVEFSTTSFKAIQVILHSRIASRVFYEFSHFQAADEKGIYKGGRDIEWNRAMNVNQYFKINTLLDQQAVHFFKNSNYLSQLLKDSLADYFKDTLGKRPSVDLKRPDVTYLLRIEGQGVKDSDWRCSVLVDMCGEPLSNRGYRAPGHRAPLRENLAAAIIKTLEWDSLNESFTDTMCGTGTLLIEAALIAGDIAPSYLRLKEAREEGQTAFAFQKHAYFLSDRKLRDKFTIEADKLLAQASEGLRNLPDGQFFANDNDMKSISIAKDCLDRAYLDGLVEFTVEDATEMGPLAENPGVVICNAPYGERLGEIDELGDLYYKYGENLKANFKGYRAYVFTSEPSLRKKISLQTSARIPMRNGNLECRLLRYNLY
ncbi:MAG: hypothetical protein KAG61_06895 [Bacteriovoracaceae bacterium]|nr:hypothetical protein [Bacteriovoracaceae bacterium]